ncbi:hypothetical protein FACS18949_03220 [Clostridia bacterium]|nr:hypothetical protein FACS18949_03220 [Clostridia bacterium]
MSKAFISAVSDNFPNAELTVDKFHVKMKLMAALDEVRKEEQKTVSKKRKLFLGQRLFMIPESKLMVRLRKKPSRKGGKRVEVC